LLAVVVKLGNSAGSEQVVTVFPGVSCLAVNARCDYRHQFTRVAAAIIRLFVPWNIEMSAGRFHGHRGTVRPRANCGASVDLPTDTYLRSDWFGGSCCRRIVGVSLIDIQEVSCFQRSDP
jgi:hypothetical protein